MRHKASGGSTSTENQYSRVVASSSGKGHGKKNLKKSGYSKGGPKPYDICNYCKEKGRWKKECPKKKHLENKSGSGSAAFEFLG